MSALANIARLLFTLCGMWAVCVSLVPRIACQQLKGCLDLACIQVEWVLVNSMASPSWSSFSTCDRNRPVGRAAPHFSHKCATFLFVTGICDACSVRAHVCRPFAESLPADSLERGMAECEPR